jgi:hypothetical protein
LTTLLLVNITLLSFSTSGSKTFIEWSFPETKRHEVLSHLADLTD